MGKRVSRVEALPKLAHEFRVAAYARVSSEKDAMRHSLSMQVSYYSNLIQSHPGWQYAGVYADEPVSGTKDSREEFQRMLSDCRAGKINMVITKLGGQTVPFLNDTAHWVWTYIFLGIWQSFGWNSIVYLAAISGINSELYEAASVDGAGRFQKMWHITLPGIRPTIVILLIMAIGNIVGSGFDRPFALQNNLVMSWAEVISTYVYRYGIKGLQFSLTTAVGLFQSVVGVIFLLAANTLSRKLGERGLW